MLQKTSGIVLNFMRYRDTSIIVKIYTEKLGIQSYIENGVRSSRSKNKIALFQPLTLLDLVVYHDEKKNLHRLSEIRCMYPFKTIPYTINKSSIGLFLLEILGKTLKEEAENKVLFDFIFHSLIAFDELEENYENFHLIFLLQLSFYLGFSPENASEIVQNFKETNIGIQFEAKNQAQINELIAATYDSKLSIQRTDRNHLLEILLVFYRLHIEGMGEIKSLDVLKEVMK
jgi:DNA repair protein RecO (recombination protein O)